MTNVHLITEIKILTHMPLKEDVSETMGVFVLKKPELLLTSVFLDPFV